MTNANATTGGLNPLFHPAAHYASPGAILNDSNLSTPEKRIILSSWASDMYTVESHPELREIPGLDHAIRLADILAALRKLDNDDDPPPRGGASMRARRPALDAGADNDDRPLDRQAAIDRCMSPSRSAARAISPRPRSGRGSSPAPA